MRIAVIGHDASDAGLAKRIAQMEADGHAVRVLSFRRDADGPRGWDNTDLGRTVDGEFRQRLTMIARAAPQVARSDAIRRADICWARNLDAALVGVAGGAGRAAPFVYECLDVHDLLSGEGVRAALARTLERRVLARATRVVVSSPAFAREHFRPRYGYTATHLIENRVVTGGSRPQRAAATGGPVTIGLFGILRCARSVRLLIDAARLADGRLAVSLRGKPAGTASDLEAWVRNEPHVRYGGPYRIPDDLAMLYEEVDLVWAGDWSQANNSRWLLPNRLYEGGWHGVPALAPEGTETARWIERFGTGAAVPEPVTPEALLAAIDAADLPGMTARLARAPDALFAAEPGEVSRVLEEAAAC